MKQVPLLRFSIFLIFTLMFTTGVFAQESENADQEAVVHIVQPGDNLYRIALRYGVTVDELAEANGITNRSRINRGQSLIIPGVYLPTEEEAYNPLVAGTPITHEVVAGETLSSIARRYGVSDEVILQANNIANPNLIYRGQSLTIWGAVTEEEDVVVAEPEAQDMGIIQGSNNTVDSSTVQIPLSGTVPYVVQSGEHLSQIAQRYGINWVSLAKINGISDANLLYAGQVLQIPALDENGQINWNALGSLPSANDPGATIQWGKQIVVDLSDQRTYAYENGELVYVTVVSTGLPDTPTVTGDYEIYHRLESQRMIGPDYDLPNVQWVQYFYEGYGLHGTYWHNNFGRPMSHGCVNMTNQAAEWFYNWASYGTPVHVQY